MPIRQRNPVVPSGVTCDCIAVRAFGWMTPKTRALDMELMASHDMFLDVLESGGFHWRFVAAWMSILTNHDK